MCIFCKIANNELPSYKVYEDEYVMAFLDLSQTTKGHTLVIPKKHVDNILELDVEDAKKMMEVVHLLGNHLLTATNARGMNILSNIHAEAGQAVFHAHIHLIPRYDESDGYNQSFVSQSYNLDEIIELVRYKKSGDHF